MGAKNMQILVLGGGVGGVVAANVLRKKLGKEHEITLVDSRSEHRFQASYPWLMMGWREPHQIVRKLNSRGIEYCPLQPKPFIELDCVPCEGIDDCCDRYEHNRHEQHENNREDSFLSERFPLQAAAPFFFVSLT